jgi:NAD(P)-dependent dehydrogenase (short-subunit alcohol dehydrogenase family)
VSIQIFDLSGRVALVIGGTSGIGREIALGFEAAGAIAVPVGRSAEKLAAVVDRLRETRPEAEGVRADVNEPAELDGLISTVAERHGRIDILVNSQGITTIKPAETFTREEVATIFTTNLTSVFFACTAASEVMARQGGGAIINITSLSAHRGFALAAPYAASKHGVLALTKTFATEWAPRGIRVNAIAPGFFMTDINRDKMNPDRKATALRRTPMQRFGSLPELVGAAIYLASPAASFVTGETIAVDGGYLANGLN